MSGGRAVNGSSEEGPQLDKLDDFQEINIPVPWGHIAGKWWGSQEVQPIIALHGWQDNCGTFDNLAPLLNQKGHSILCIDLPGHGLSSHLPPGHKYYIWWDGIHYLRRIVKYYKWKNIVILGHSLGGGIAFLYSAVYPDEVKKYISIDLASPSVRNVKKCCDVLGPAIDKFLSYEKLTADSVPCYPYNEMLEILVDAHKGSVNRQGCEILLKRGILPAKNRDGYCFTRDPRLKLAALGFLSIEQVMELASRIVCEVMNIKATKGYQSDVPEHYDLVLDTIEKQAKTLQRHKVEGTHHLHLNDGFSVGSCFEGQWQNGKRHGLGVETRGRWIYRGEWTQGFKGRYGVRQSNTSTAKYQGTWANGLQDGYGSETYADDGTYQGQWMRGMRHGYGVRTSAPFGKASKYRGQKALRGSLTSLRSSEPGATPLDAAEKRDRRVDDSRGGFVLQSKSTEPTSASRRRSLGSGNIKKNIFKGILKKGASTGELDRRTGSGSIRSNASSVSYISTDSAGSVMTNASMPSDSNASFVIDDEHMDPNITETYMGEWSNDKRSGYGISERSDGLRYEGEWYANKKYGYGVTTFSNGEKEEGKYKNNVLITSQKKKKLFLMRSAKFRERIDAAVNAAQRASKIALQKADIAISRTATARGKAEQADIAAAQAREDSEVADTVARQYAPDFKQPGLERLKRQMKYREPNRNLDISIDQKELNATSALPNQIPNQTPNQVGNEILSQIPNKVTKPIGNQISNQLPNQTPISNYSQTNTYHQQATYQQQNTYQPQTNPHQQNTFQQQHNSYSQQQNPYQQQQQQNQKSFHATNNNPNTNNFFNATNNPASFVNEFGPQAPNNNLQNTGNEFNASLNNPRNSLTGENVPNTNSIRRMSRRVSGDRPYLGNIGQQSSIDHFDHYKRPPSRDSSVDRYSRATGRLSNSLAGSRQPSVDRNSTTRLETPDRTLRAPSTARGSTPVTSAVNSGIKNGSVPTGQGALLTSHNNSTPPFEEVILRKRGLGQDIVPSLNQPKRTESLFIPGQPNLQAAKVLATQTSLQRKKSLPDVQELPRATRQMPREEVSILGSARREEVRRQIDERERLRANPLLYLISPQVKDWFSRQQLVLVVLFINISLAIMFFKLLT